MTISSMRFTRLLPSFSWEAHLHTLGLTGSSTLSPVNALMGTNMTSFFTRYPHVFLRNGVSFFTHWS